MKTARSSEGEFYCDKKKWLTQSLSDADQKRIIKWPGAVQNKYRLQWGADKKTSPNDPEQKFKTKLR